MGIYDRDYYRQTRLSGAIPALAEWSMTTWIIVVNVAVFVLDRVIFRLPVAVNTPAGIMVMTPMSAIGNFSVWLAFDHWQLWRLVTYQFLHAGVGHLFFNMLGLYFFGPMVESRLGPRRYLAFYLGSGVGGALGFTLLWLTGGFELPSWAMLIGASGCVFGVLIAVYRLTPNVMVTTLLALFIPIRMTIRTMVLLYIGLALLSVLSRESDAGSAAAHLGGAAAGWLLCENLGLLNIFNRFPSAARVLPLRRPPGRKSYSAAVEQHNREHWEAEVDRILAKIHRDGLASLTEAERQTLLQANRMKSGR